MIQSFYQKHKEKTIAYGLTLGIPGLLLLFFSMTGSFETWNRKISDATVQIFPDFQKFSKDVVIIDIDENSLAHYADHPEVGRWPWKRSIYPSIYAYLNMGEAEIIINDILFTERSAEDTSLAIANQSFPNISHAVAFRLDADNSSISIPRYTSGLSVDLDDSIPLPFFQKGAFPNGTIGETSTKLHSVNVIPDRDGVVRRFPPFVRIGSSEFSTLASMGFFGMQPIEGNVRIETDHLYLKKSEKSYEYKLVDGNFIRAYFYSREAIQNIPRYSASAVLESFSRIQEGLIEDESQLLVPLSELKGKVVILGTTAPATHDDVVTPFGLFPGVMSQAVFVSNLREGHFWKEISISWGIAFTVILLLILSYSLFESDKNWQRIVVPAGFFFAIGVSSFLAHLNSILLPLFPLVTVLPISFLLGYSYVTYKEGKEKRKYDSVLRNLVDPSVVNHALQDLDALKKGGEWEITAFFSDVAGFSSISEELSATDLASLLNEYLSAMTEDLKSNRGTLDKYIGDAIVGIFGAPLQNNTHPKDACSAALAMTQTIEVLRAEWNAKGKYTPTARAMEFRIGLNCGRAKVGFMGTESLASYTMMGDTVNLAARLEAAAKDYGVKILASESMQKTCSDVYDFWLLDLIRVKGKDQPVVIYNLVGKKGETSDETKAFVQTYELGFQAYKNREWDKAIFLFEKAISLKGKKDKACSMLIERCNLYKMESPPESWDGVFTRTTK